MQEHRQAVWLLLQNHVSYHDRRGAGVFDELSHYSGGNMLLFSNRWVLEKKTTKKQKANVDQQREFSFNRLRFCLNSIENINYSNQEASVTPGGSKRLKSLTVGGSDIQDQRFWLCSLDVSYSTSLGLSVWSFLMTGRGCASVLKTQCSNGRWSSSENSR